MFHEFGHALHGLSSDVRYPSQVNEMWAWEPRILAAYAVHHETGEPMPAQWVATLLEARQDGEGFATTEYLSVALLDQAWYRLSPDEVPTTWIPSRLLHWRRSVSTSPRFHPATGSTYLNHIFGGGYSAAYYSYIWSEGLDADTVEWFNQNGGLRRENGDTFRHELLSVGGSVDPMLAFRRLRGREPEIGPLLRRRALEG